MVGPRGVKREACGLGGEGVCTGRERKGDGVRVAKRRLGDRGKALYYENCPLLLTLVRACSIHHMEHKGMWRRKMRRPDSEKRSGK